MDGETSGGGKRGHENTAGRATGITVMRYHSQERQEKAIQNKFL